MVVHRLLGALADAAVCARARRARASPAPLVGRDEELDRLLARLRRMQDGRAQVVSLVGEAGSRQVAADRRVPRAARGDGRLAGIAVRRATCSSLGEPTYGVFGALFREGLRVEPDDTLEVARAQAGARPRARSAPTPRWPRRSRRC